MGWLFEAAVAGGKDCVVAGLRERCSFEDIKLARKFCPGLGSSGWPAGFLPAVVFYLTLG